MTTMIHKYDQYMNLRSFEPNAYTGGIAWRNKQYSSVDQETKVCLSFRIYEIGCKSHTYQEAMYRCR